MEANGPIFVGNGNFREEKRGASLFSWSLVHLSQYLPDRPSTLGIDVAK